MESQIENQDMLIVKWIWFSSKMMNYELEMCLN